MEVIVAFVFTYHSSEIHQMTPDISSPYLQYCFEKFKITINSSNSITDTEIIWCCYVDWRGIISCCTLETVFTTSTDGFLTLVLIVSTTTLLLLYGLIVVGLGREVFWTNDIEVVGFWFVLLIMTLQAFSFICSVIVQM